MGRWEEGNGGSLSSLFPLPIVPRALSFSFSPASPQHKEASAEERVWVVAPGTQEKSPMDLRQIAQEIRVSGPLSPESFYTSLNKKGIVAAENRWKIALTLCKLCELSKNVSVACQAIFAKYMYWFFFTSQMLMVTAFGQKSILKLLVSSVELRSHPETSSTDVWCFITLASRFRIALMCLTNQPCGSNILSHVKGNENLREAKPIPFSRYNKRFAPWGCLKYKPFYITCIVQK